MDLLAHKFRGDGGSGVKRRSSSCRQEGSTEQGESLPTQHLLAPTFAAAVDLDLPWRAELGTHIRRHCNATPAGSSCQTGEEKQLEVLTERSALTLGAVAHAALRWLQEVDQEVPAVADGNGDAEQAAVLGAAAKELPGGAGGELAELARRWQRGVPQGQPDGRLRAAVVHLRGQERVVRRLFTPPGPGSYLHAAGRQLRRPVVDLEPVPAR